MRMRMRMRMSTTTSSFQNNDMIRWTSAKYTNERNKV